MSLTKEQKEQNAACYLSVMNNPTTEIEFLDVLGEWKQKLNSRFLPNIKYRLKPKPEMGPWDCKEDVPLNCWIKSINGEAHIFVAFVRDDGIGFEDNNLPWDKLFRYYEYSTDRKTWKRCAKENK